MKKLNKNFTRFLQKILLKALITIASINCLNIEFLEAKNIKTKQRNHQNEKEIAKEQVKNNPQNNNIGDKLSLEEYLKQINSNNPAVISYNQQEEASELLKNKAKLITGFNVFSSAKSGFYQQNQAAQIFRYSQYYYQNYQVGVSQTNNLGINSKLYYSLNKINYKDFNTSMFPNPSLASSNVQTNPIAELSIPLWQNFLGRSTKSSKDVIIYSQESSKLNNQDLINKTNIDAEKTYWNLVIACKILNIQQNNLKRSQAIFNYVNKKLAMNLAEKSDMLQAKASVEQALLELEQAKNNEEYWINQFNKARYVFENEKIDNLQEINYKEIQKLTLPFQQQGNRPDTKAAEAQMKLAIANNKIEAENSKPNLSLDGYYALKGLQAGTRTALDNSFINRGAEASVAVKFSMPVNFHNTNSVMNGANQSINSAKNLYRYLSFSEQKDWQDIVRNFNNLQKNLQISQKIENAQKLKIENERSLLEQGRTTTYQILLFEQEYFRSQIKSLEIARQLLSLNAEAKSYKF